MVDAAPPRSVLAPTALETEHVHNVYDAIAPHFSHTRHTPWPLVVEFLNALAPGSLVADVGCGNGKYLRVNPALCVIGADRSVPLLAASSIHGNASFNLLGCDALAVPLRSGAFDAAISIAVLHHISTVERRLALISELARIVKVGGSIYIVAWAFEQDASSKRQFEEQDVMVEWKLQEKYVEPPREEVQQSQDAAQEEAAAPKRGTRHAKKDAVKRWVVYQRYCHVYKRGELEALVAQVPGLEVLETQYSRSNWCLRVARVAAYFRPTRLLYGLGRGPPMDRTQDTDDETDKALRASGDDSRDASENGDELHDEAPPRLGADGADDDDQGEEEEEDDGDDSDAETQRIGTSVLRFARRCVKTGEFAKATAALLNVVEISELRAAPCRQALLFAAQVFMVTSQETRALECVLELWDNMPPPYTRQDGQMLLAVLYERLEQPRFAQYWFSRAFTSGDGDVDVVAPSPSATLTAWLSLAERSFEEGDMILSTESYSRAFGCIFQAQRWPAELLVFRFVSRFLTALVSVAHLRHDRRAYRQQIAFSLAVTLLQSDAIDCIPLGERAFGSDYVALRRVYATSFPTVYEYLFGDEDRFVGRIARAWRMWRARRASRQAIEERERQKLEALLAAKAARAANAKKKKPKPKPRQASPTRSDDERDGERLRLQLRLRTKARVESLRSASPVKKTTTKTRSPLKPTFIHDHDTPSVETVASPTRRKLETVKRLRGVTTATDPEQIQEADRCAGPTSPGGNQPPTSSEAASSSPSRAASLLDVYAFPPLASRRLAFQADAGRPQGPADLDDELQDIEEFARLAHYRSRVLIQRHQPIEGAAKLERVAPQWLRRFQDVVAFVEAHDRHFSEIHARVVRQLGLLHAQYVLQHGKTMFTIRFTATLRRLESWQCTNVAQELRALQRVGEREEAHRNLEVFHALQHTQTRRRSHDDERLGGPTTI